jgi:3-hydroxyisobutyrate dehydrogenase-like beta-hydroxyacid dehydrogenase
VGDVMEVGFIGLGNMGAAMAPKGGCHIAVAAL